MQEETELKIALQFHKLALNFCYLFKKEYFSIIELQFKMKR